MKNKILTFGLAFVLICSAFLFSACVQTSQPHIKVKGIATEYYVGDSLNLTNAKIEYYVNQTSIIYDEFQVKSNMVTGFSTATVGEFTMTITFNTLSTTLKYTVSEYVEPEDPDGPIEESVAREKLTAAYANLVAHNKVKFVTTSSVMGMVNTSTDVVTQDVMYTFNSEQSRAWIKKVGGIWYEFVQEEQYFTKRVIDVPNDDVRLYQFDEAMISNLTFIEASKLGNTYTLKFDVFVAEYGIMAPVTFTISNNEVVSMVTDITIDYEGFPLNVVLNLVYTFDSAVTEIIPELPVPVEDWLLITE